jgi:hypothetical protein
MRRTIILHANGAKLPTDLLGLTCVRYAEELTPAEIKTVNRKLRKAIEAEGRLARIDGLWWQYSQTARTEDEPSAVSLLLISRNRNGGLEVQGRAWQEDGTLSARYWSEATKERTDPAGILYFWNGERPRHPDAPQLEGPVRSSSSPRTAPAATGRPARTGPRSSTLGLPGSTCALTPRTWPCWTAATHRGAPNSSRIGSGTGRRSRTPE